jgi:DUF1016 N-terminal domain
MIMSDKHYRQLLADFIRQVEGAFAHDLNASLLYFAIGNFILNNEDRRDYNREMLYRLFRGFQKHFGEKRRMPMPNPTQMRKVAAAYRSIDSPALTQGLQWLTWEHHVQLVSKVRETPAMLFYLELAREADLSCEEMIRWIDFGLYERFARRQLSQTPQSPASLSPK